MGSNPSPPDNLWLRVATKYKKKISSQKMHLPDIDLLDATAKNIKDCHKLLVRKWLKIKMLGFHPLNRP